MRHGGRTGIVGARADGLLGVVIIGVFSTVDTRLGFFLVFELRCRW